MDKEERKSEIAYDNVIKNIDDKLELFKNQVGVKKANYDAMGEDEYAFVEFAKKRLDIFMDEVNLRYKDLAEWENPK